MIWLRNKKNPASKPDCTYAIRLLGLGPQYPAGDNWWYGSMPKSVALSQSKSLSQIVGQLITSWSIFEYLSLSFPPSRRSCCNNRKQHADASLVVVQSEPNDKAVRRNRRGANHPKHFPRLACSWQTIDVRQAFYQQVIIVMHWVLLLEQVGKSFTNMQNQMTTQNNVRMQFYFTETRVRNYTLQPRWDPKWLTCKW